MTHWTKKGGAHVIWVCIGWKKRLGFWPHINVGPNFDLGRMTFLMPLHKLKSGKSAYAKSQKRKHLFKQALSRHGDRVQRLRVDGINRVSTPRIVLVRYSQLDFGSNCELDPKSNKNRVQLQLNRNQKTLPRTWLLLIGLLDEIFLHGQSLLSRRLCRCVHLLL